MISLFHVDYNYISFSVSSKSYANIHSYRFFLNCDSKYLASTNHLFRCSASLNLCIKLMLRVMYACISLAGSFCIFLMLTTGPLGLEHNILLYQNINPHSMTMLHNKYFRTFYCWFVKMYWHKHVVYIL